MPVREPPVNGTHGTIITISELLLTRYSAKVLDAAPRFHQLHFVADFYTIPCDSRSQTSPTVERYDRELIRRIPHELGRGRMYHGFGVNHAGAHIAPKTVTTAVAPEPPRFCAKPMEWRSS
jgi:hypothetical protein